MTYEEALRFWKDDLQNVEACVESYPSAFYQELHDAFKIGIEAIEKQIPKKPTEQGTSPDDENYKYGGCPTCTATVFCDTQFCDNCGQALDWED